MMNTVTWSLTLDTCNSLAGSAAWEYALWHPDANVFQHLHEIGSATPVAHVNAGYPQAVWTSANEDAGFVTVE
jgi:hypothetical protein